MLLIVGNFALLFYTIVAILALLISLMLNIFYMNIICRLFLHMLVLYVTSADFSVVHVVDIYVTSIECTMFYCFVQYMFCWLTSLSYV